MNNEKLIRLNNDKMMKIHEKLLEQMEKNNLSCECIGQMLTEMIKQEVKISMPYMPQLLISDSHNNKLIEESVKMNTEIYYKFHFDRNT